MIVCMTCALPMGMGMCFVRAWQAMLSAVTWQEWTSKTGGQILSAVSNKVVGLGAVVVVVLFFSKSCPLSC